MLDIDYPPKQNYCVQLFTPTLLKKKNIYIHSNKQKFIYIYIIIKKLNTKKIEKINAIIPKFKNWQECFMKMNVRFQNKRNIFVLVNVQRLSSANQNIEIVNTDPLNLSEN